MLNGEDCLNEVSYAAAQLFEAAQEISGSSVAFSFLFLLAKQKK